MSTSIRRLSIQGNLVHPDDSFSEFKKVEIEQSIPERFAQHVNQYYQEIAVRTKNYNWTYSKLNELANRIAHKIFTLYGSREQRIALLLEHDAPMIAATLGVLKLGKTYVPLDLSFPQERLAYMLMDSEVEAILTNSLNLNFTQNLVKNTSQDIIQIINIDEQIIDISEINISESCDEINLSISPDTIAYILYTSGSTGQPKGVIQSHRNVLHHTRIWINSLQISKHDRLTLLSSYSWDSAVQDTFGALLSGASLYPINVKQEGLANLADWLIDQEITIYHSTLPLYRYFARNLTTEKKFPKLRLLILGGDLIHKGDIDLHRKHFSNESIVVNAYGSTESSTCLQYFVDMHTDMTHNVLPVGYEVEDTEVLLLDETGKQVEVNGIGEIAIRSDYLALGYWQKPKITKTKFKPDPQGGTRRVYYTGDLGRLIQDGSIILVGRKDFQVKIRGFRIELGEIEAVLNQHPHIREAVVMVQENVPGEKRLVAYIVPDQEQTHTISELRSFLKKRLPDHLMPSVFMILEALPLTPNHKVDRKALPKPSQTRPNLEGAFVVPSTSIEQRMAKIWSEVLNLKQVGIHDNFFELGGDSILSLQVIAKAKQVGLQITVQQLFKHPTIVELVAVADMAPTIEAEQGLVTGSVPLTPIQHWVFEQNFPNLEHWSQAVLLEVQQIPDLTLLEKAVQQLLIHHDALRIRFVKGESDWLQVITSPDNLIVPFTKRDLSALSDKEQEPAIEAVVAEMKTSLNCSEGSLLRIVFLNLGSHKPSRLLLLIHQLIIDGVSWRILLEDLQTAYQQLKRNETIQLPSKTTSFKYWAERLTEYAKLESLRQELATWLAMPLNKDRRLPVIYPESAGVLTGANNVSMLLSIEETRALIQDVPKFYNTQITDVLLTALVQSFSQWTRSSSLLVDLLSHGRESIIENVDLSRTVGWFTSISPVLLDISEADTLENALKLVRDQLSRIPNRGISYGLLRFLSKDVEIAERLESLQSEVSFNYLGQFDQVLPESSLFRIARESAHILRGRPSHPMEITVTIIGGQLQLDWTYSENTYQRSIVKQLAQDFVEVIRLLLSIIVIEV
ncbi:amino acid adenylation domain-containing protein [Nostoc sp. CHAB 5824]|nr:amino acid adenylation domain-containing protein [Nostoc sp. CHAB 5824]